MIYLTGDVHTKSMGGWEQEKIGSEVIASKKYLDILKKFNISCTLFINGKCFEEEKEEVRKLLYYNVEFGGHTYNNFGKLGVIKSYAYRKLFKCIYGNKDFQTKDIVKTKKIFEKFGLKMISWRTHAFGSNEETFKILKQAGVRYVSDLVGDIAPFEKEVFHIPINIPVDQNTISYGKLNPKNRDPFASCVKGRISAEEWFEILKKRVISNEKRKIDSILLIHPATMAALDNFKLFEQIAKFLSKYESRKISEINKNNILK
jgi:peptidoglycan/xylan/chitin deacetylase (PgdA/CDA1 family)